MNIKAISTYDLKKGYSNSENNKPINTITPPKPTEVNDGLAFKANGNPSFFERVANRIRNFDPLTSLGTLKQKIETAGFVALFLIQDGLGMTLPRTWTGFNRDIEITGKYHIQEGLEVFGREGLTGPAMMAIPAGVFALTRASMGKSTYVNTRLIKSFGKTVVNLVKNNSYNSAEQLKSAVLENGLRKMYRETVGTEASADVISKVMAKLERAAQVKAFERPKSMTIDEIKKTFGDEYGIDAIKAITQKEGLKADSVIEGGLLKKVVKAIKSDLSNPMQAEINNALLETSGADLSRLNKVILDGNKFDVKEATNGLIAYAHDSATRVKNVSDLSAEKAEEFMNSMIGKRWTSNVAAGATVLGVMNYLPKLYAFGDKPPGETSKCEAAHRPHPVDGVHHKHHGKHVHNTHDHVIDGSLEKSGEVKKGDVAFTGLFSKMGSKIANWKDFALAEGEFHGFNFSNTLMSAISIVGLTIPRASRAYERAPIKDPETRKNEGWFSRLFKKDISEIKEILVRDPLSALFVVFAVPLATRGMIKSYEKTSGFVLINHEADEGKGFKKFLKYLNPYNGIGVISNSELDALYGGIDSHNKLVNVCEYLDKKGGDLEKIFSKAEMKEEVFNENSFTLKSLRNLKTAEKNKQILEYIKAADSGLQTKMVDSLLPALKKLKNNKALGIAKSLSSIPFLLNLIVVSPFLLGVTIPKYTYKLTRKSGDKLEVNAEQDNNTKEIAKEAAIKKTADDGKLVKQTA